MAKTHPYFKFYCSEWNDGDITLEDFATQGLFINICSLYWSRECSLTLNAVKRRFKGNENNLKSLLDENLIKTYQEPNGNLNETYIKIRFLDEQWTGKDGRASTSRLNGAKGGRPPKPNKPNITQYREEESIEDKRIEESNKEKPTPPPINPAETTKPKAGKIHEFADIYSKVKPFDPMNANFQSAYYQAVNVADGEDVVNMAASMFVQYCNDIGKPIQYIPNVGNWLSNRQFNTDWRAESMKELEELAEKGDKEAEKKYFEYYVERNKK